MEVSPKKGVKGPRACTTCAKAKSRCIPGPDGRTCERCHRLHKSCSSQTPAPPRRRKSPKPTRVSELERRIEDLTSRIESARRGHRDQVLTPPESLGEGGPLSFVSSYDANGVKKRVRPFGHLFPNQFDETDELIAQPDLTSPPDDSSAATTALSNHATPATTLSNTPAASILVETLPAALLPPPVLGNDAPWPGDDEAAALLVQYEKNLAHTIPFIVVPPHLLSSSNELRSHRPLLWKGIMMQACRHDGRRQMALGEALLAEIAVATASRTYNKLDVLQGLQILMSSYNYNMNNFQLTNLLFLARGISAGLGIGAAVKGIGEDQYTSDRLERVRAYLGTYYLVTVVFSTSKRPDGWMSTSQLEGCCQALDTMKEHSSDELLVWLLRAMRLIQSISETLASRHSSSKSIDITLGVLMKGFQQQLEHFKMSIPLHLKDHPSINTHMHTATMILYEIALLPDNGLAPMDRLEALWACAAAVREFYVLRHAEPICEHPRFIAFANFDYVYALTVAIKLIRLAGVPGWDPQAVRAELRLDEMLEKQATNIQWLAERRRHGSAVDENGPEDPFAALAHKMQVLKNVLRTVDSDKGLSESLERTLKSGAMTVTDAVQEIAADLETNFWQSLLGPSDDWDVFDGFPFSF